MFSKPRFITFEGGEAAGKSTQIEKLGQRLTELGHRVLLTREPGGTPLGESIRHLLKHAPEGRGMAAKTELLLFLASRAELVDKVIVPALEQGSWVLCDRFLDSTMVYQGAGRHQPGEIVERLNAFAVGPHLPDLTLVLDLEPEEARRRLKGRAQPAVSFDRMEAEPADFYARVRQGYRDLASAHPDRVKILEAGGSIETTSEAIWWEVANEFSIGEK
jgi:dTMP kinase